MSRKCRLLSPPLCSAVLAASLALSLQVGLAQTAQAATEIIDSEFSNCTGINCSSTSIAGFVASFGNSVTPWAAKVFATNGTCLRLDVSFVRSGNLEMVVIEPNGATAYRRSGGGSGGAGAPLVKISPTPAQGYYTVIVSSPNGGKLNTDFHLLFGQYNAGNPNCNNPTPSF